MSDERELLRRTAELAADFIDTLDERPVFPLTPVEELGTALEGPLPEGPTEPSYSEMTISKPPHGQARR